MGSILQNEAIDKLPVAELQAKLAQFLQPVLRRLPEKRLRAVSELAVQGILSSQSPLVTQMARGVVREEETIWPAAKRFYRFVWNKRFSHRDLLKGLYAIAQRTVAEHEPSHLVVAIELSGVHCRRGEPTRASGDLRELVLLRDSRLCQ